MLVLTGIALAQTPAPRPEFEVASIKLNTSGNGMTMIRPPVGGRFTATNARLKMLIGLAYKLQDYEISGGPGWINTDGYDITAKATDSNIGVDQLRPMLRALLEDRFQLKVHRESKEVPVYALLPGKNGLKTPRGQRGRLHRVRFQLTSTPTPGRRSISAYAMRRFFHGSQPSGGRKSRHGSAHRRPFQDSRSPRNR